MAPRGGGGRGRRALRRRRRCASRRRSSRSSASTRRTSTRAWARVDAERLARSEAVIVNIDYPLGLAAYNILREVAVDSGELRGVYVLGKAATLNADVGDVMLSSVVHDEHSGTTYWLDNAFAVDDIEPDLRFGTGLDNQRAVTVKSTFLQNRAYLDFYYREAFTVVEMEAGPYCNAVYEIADADRYPVDEAVNFSKLPIDFGVIHYASDTPYTRRARSAPAGCPTTAWTRRTPRRWRSSAASCASRARWSGARRRRRPGCRGMPVVLLGRVTAAGGPARGCRRRSPRAPHVVRVDLRRHATPSTHQGLRH